jgi:hypothetical protein
LLFLYKENSIITNAQTGITAAELGRVAVPSVIDKCKYLNYTNGQVLASFNEDAPVTMKKFKRPLSSILNSNAGTCVAF